MFPRNAPNSQLSSIFLGLSLIGFALLPGLAIHHGLLDIFHTALKSGKFRTDYTGHPAIDKQLAQLIAFFEMALTRPGLRPLTFSFSGLLGTTLTVAQFAAGSSNSAKAWLLPFPIGILCQMYGAGFAFPLLFSFLYMTGFGERKVSARGWIPSLGISFFLAGLPMLMPLPFLSQHQTRTFEALWQAFPVSLVILRAVLRPFSPDQSPKSALKLIGWLAFAMHIQGLVELYLIRDKLYALSLTSRNPAEVATVFLTFDYIMVVISTVVFVLAANRQVYGARMAVMSFIVGPGAAIAWGLADAPEDKEITKKKA